MMFKKSAVIFLCFIMTVLCGCSEAFGGNNGSLDTDSNPDTGTESQEPIDIKYTNPLTGIKELEPSQKNLRPFAIMVNNITTAQGVQTGLNKADIVYETEVEGGITRLMAVFQDVTGLKRIGTIRSARYPYVDLALGHNAIYVHCGQDPNYCKPHLADIDDMSVDKGQYGERIANGLSKEHTLYSTGDLLQQGAKKHKFSTTLDSVSLWANFADEITDIGPNVCSTVKVPFNNTYTTKFTYDATTGLYTRYMKDKLWKDYVTGETKEVTNVFVLMTDITYYPDGYHRKVALEGGKGYYVSGGKYTEITWKKGKATNGFSFTDANGNDITVNPGKSWVCIADRTRTTPSFS